MIIAVIGQVNTVKIVGKVAPKLSSRVADGVRKDMDIDIDSNRTS